MLSLLTFLTGSKLGRYAAVVGITGLIIILVIARSYSAGRKSAQTKTMRQKLRRLSERIEVNDEINSMSDTARRDALSEWMRD